MVVTLGLEKKRTPMYWPVAVQRVPMGQAVIVPDADASRGAAVFTVVAAPLL